MESPLNPTRTTPAAWDRLLAEAGDRGRGRPAQVLGLALLGLCVYYMYRALSSNWRVLADFDFGKNPLYWAYSIPLLVASTFLEPRIWQLLLEKFGHRLGFTKSYSIYYISQLGRYVPGRVWSYLGAAYLASKEEIPFRDSLVTSLMLTLLNTLVGPCVLISALAFSGEFEIWAVLLANVGYFALCAAVLRSDWPRKVVGFFLRRQDREMGELPFRFAFKEWLHVTALHYLAWLLWGLGYWFAVNAVFSLDARLAVVFVGMYGVAILAGLYALFVPGGLGVRESVNTWMMSFFIAQPLAAAISLLVRFWYTVGVAVSFSLALLFRCFLGRKEKHER